MSKFLTALLLMGACMTVAAQDNDSASKKKSKAAATKTVKKEAPSKKKAAGTAAAGAAAGAAAAQGTDEEDREPETAGSTGLDYNCALGDKVTIFSNAEDDKHIALRWNKRLMRLTRVETTTGAHRFENRRQGMVWIGIPAKGILLDSKKGQQLANECKSAEQLKPSDAPAAPGLGIQ
ncbi:MAG TPA: hypothetical protein VF797_12280 [Noviherbaspirillum sp.]|jgi:hypothetical protein|uniref:hypothetical protein n=1 Tax=Noviherbaspirillum sp. L7-7A TaxID=2850560 RepID=UPI001C2B799C|nr:hypothetical protein [Noviherbaspirillum sp. L7-7A]MBV0878437.1 hypothetical protein [Noviherbaspirillum sp. L7-7A]